MKTIMRADAKRLGLKRYCTGRPCKRGHVAERLVSVRICVECNRVSTRAWQAANPEKERAKSRAWMRKWYAENPDQAAARNGRTNALERAPGCVPPGFDYHTTERFYAKARCLTRETGVKHVVDHRHALCLGGKHHARNLQVLTAKENDKKAKVEQAEAERRKQ